MTENQQARQKLKNELRKLFQFDVSDLDFGIYRILNRKKDQIEEFIERDLLDAVNEGLKEYQEQDASQVEDIKQKIIENLSDDAFDEQGNLVKYESTKLGKEYLEALEKAEKKEIGPDTEKKIYNDLFTFFSRYYDNGDFLSKRRISTRDSKYAVPYNGEEVLLHWANKDQYYIKTGEQFTSFKFELDGGKKSVWFKVAQAETEKDNVKEEENRSFVLRPENPIEVNGDEFTLWFEYRPLTNEEEDKWLNLYKKVEKSRKTVDRSVLCIAYNEFVLNTVDKEWRDLLSVIPKNKDRSLLYQKLNQYTGKNTTDYFIHKDLKSFLERELEYYLKNEVIRVDDFIEDRSQQAMEVALTRAKVVRQIGQKIIAFLSQIENFQKKLFEKKKFVVDTHYCFTLDVVPKDLYEIILENKEQLQSWEELYAMDKWKGELEWDGKWTKAFLNDHAFMMLDTQYFDEDFKFELLSTFDDLEEIIEGLAINGENFQGINILNRKYNESVKYIYIDPPYNAKSSEIIYKNSFKHSSWMSLMENRISLSKKLQNKNSVLTVAIDEVEQERLGQLLSFIYPEHEKNCITVNHNPSGQQGDNFSYTHEFAYFIYPSPGRYIAEEFRENEADWDKRNFRDVTGKDSLRAAGKNCFYPIYIKDGKVVDFGEVSDDDYHPDINEELEDGRIAVYPIDPEGIERKWRFARNTVDSIRNELIVHYLEKRGVYDIKRLKKKFNYKSNWTDSKYSGNNHGTQVLNQILPDNPFSYPKSIHLVKDCVLAGMTEQDSGIILDYFAGSGTTGHAVLNLNKEDNGQRKYILIEMGQYFDTVLKPRIQKVVFSNNWKDGIPQDQDGQSHAFKYHFIESYEDALNNIHFKNPEDTQEAMQFEDYMLHYMLNFETQGVSATLLKEDAFDTPFDYQLNIQRGHDSPKPEAVDMVETFHYLIGLWVQSLRRYDHQNRKYVVSKGQIRDEDAVEDVCIIWRNASDLDLDKEAKWIQETILQDQTFDRIYINGVNKIKNAEPIELTFREKMFEDIA